MCNVKSFEQCDLHLDGGRDYISSCTTCYFQNFLSLRNSFLLSRSPIVSFGLPFTILVFISLPVKTVRGRHNMPSLMPASAMFDLRKNISEFAEKKTRRKSNLHFYIFSDFSDRRVGETIFQKTTALLILQNSQMLANISDHI